MKVGLVLMFLMLGVNIMPVLVIVCRAVHVRRARNPRESYIGSTVG